MDHTEGRTQLYIPALGPLYEKLAEFAYPAIRIVAGMMLWPHGAQKLFEIFGGNRANAVRMFNNYGLEPAEPLVWLVGTVEFFGGLCLVLGLFTRPAAILGACVLAVATFKVHLPLGFFWSARGIEYPLMWLVLLLVVAIRGAGAYSLDRRLGREF